MKEFKMNIQLFAGEQVADPVSVDPITPVKYVGQEALEELVTKMKAYTDAKGIPTINQNDIRITDYDAGVYIWHPTTAGQQYYGHKIYYNGTAGEEYANIVGAYLGDLTLLITKSRSSSTNYSWVWLLLAADEQVYLGKTTANAGAYKEYNIRQFVTYSDVINNLTTSSFVQGQVLHARQGKILKDSIDALTTTVNGKQDILTFDTAPTENSANPVTSGGLYTKFNLKADKSEAVGSFDLSIDNTTYVITLQAKDVNGNNIGTAKTIDLPLESVVVSGSYDSTTKKVLLTLKDGSTVDFSVADLISGLQSEITSTNKLSADLVDDTNTTHKFVTSSDKTTWNNKQNAITNSSKLSADLVDDTNATHKFVSATDIANWNSKQNAITSSSKLSADLVDDTNTTHKFVTDTDITNWNNTALGIKYLGIFNADLSGNLSGSVSNLGYNIDNITADGVYTLHVGFGAFSSSSDHGAIMFVSDHYSDYKYQKIILVDEYNGTPRFRVYTRSTSSSTFAGVSFVNKSLSTVATTGSYNDLLDKPTGISVDSALSSTSENAVQNKVINAALNNKLNITDIDAALSSSSTNPLQNKVVNSAIYSLSTRIPTQTSQLTNNSGFVTTVTALSTIKGARAGYLKFSNGLLIQWGRTERVSDNGNRTVTFSQEFSAIPSVATSSEYNADDGAWNGAYYVTEGSISTKGFTVHSRGNKNGGRLVTWIAIGYKA